MLSHTLWQKAVGADTSGQKSTVTRIGYYYIAFAFYSYIGNQWSLECGRIKLVFLVVDVSINCVEVSAGWFIF